MKGIPDSVVCGTNFANAPKPSGLWSLKLKLAGAADRDLHWLRVTTEADRASLGI